MAERQYWVVCSTYRKGPYPLRAQAERMRAQIEHMGGCREQHQIVCMELVTTDTGRRRWEEVQGDG